MQHTNTYSLLMYMAHMPNSRNAKRVACRLRAMRDHFHLVSAFGTINIVALCGCLSRRAITSSVSIVCVCVCVYIYRGTLDIFLTA